jgi:hypothetical protein
MPQPHKGQRVLINVTVSRMVVDLIDHQVELSGVSSRSQLLADRVSAYFGRWDLVRELNREHLELGVPRAMRPGQAADSADSAEVGEEEMVSIRVPHEVAPLIDREARLRGERVRRHYVAYLVSKLYDPEGVSDEVRKEQLELPTRHEPAVA